MVLNERLLKACIVERLFVIITFGATNFVIGTLRWHNDNGNRNLIRRKTAVGVAVAVVFVTHDYDICIRAGKFEMKTDFIIFKNAETSRYYSFCSCFECHR